MQWHSFPVPLTSNTSMSYPSTSHRHSPKCAKLSSGVESQQAWVGVGATIRESGNIRDVIYQK